MSRWMVSIVVLTGLTLIGCTHATQNVDYDKRVNFASLKTYAWDDIKESGTKYRTANGKSVADIVRDAVDSSLASKGYAQATDSAPSFRVHVYTQLQYKSADVAQGDAGAIAQSRAQAAENPIPAAPGGGSMPSSYSEGTVVIDMLDPATSKSIWRGAAVGVLRENVTPEQRAQRLDQEVRKLMDQFPPK